MRSLIVASTNDAVVILFHWRAVGSGALAGDRPRRSLILSPTDSKDAGGLRSMMADASDEAWLDLGKGHTAMLYALVNSTSKIARALAVGVAE
jgi:hypothetical protein